MQLFGMHYRGIVDAPNLEWYTAILDEYKLLDINDFLHNGSPYVVTQPLLPKHAAPSNVSQSARHSAMPPRCILELDIFESVERARERSSDTREDTPSLGTLYGEGSRGFNQFGTIQGEVTISDLITKPGAFAAAGGIPVSSSQGYQFQDPIGSGLAEAGNSVVRRSSGFNLFESRGRLQNEQVQVVA
jgi:hypothetical protein